MNPQLLQNKPDKNNLVCVFWSAYAYIFAEHISRIRITGSCVMHMFSFSR